MSSSLLSRVAAVALTVAVALPAGAQSFDLTFSGLGLPNYGAIPGTYGDIPGALDVSYIGRTDWGNGTVVASSAYYWNTGYNDLVDVAYFARDGAGGGGGNVQVGEILLTPLGGNSVFFGSADLGAFNSVSRPVELRVYDSAYNLLYSAGGATVGTTTHASFAAAVSSATGLRVQWSGLSAAGGAPQDAYNTGIDNVAGRVGPAVVATPEPATLVLVAGGLVLVGATARRRRAAA